MTSQTDQDLVRSATADARTGSTGWVRVRCPFCPSRIGKEDRRMSFGLQAETGHFHCFRCGIAGHLSDVEIRPSLPEFKAQRETTQAMVPPEAYTGLWKGAPGYRAMTFHPARTMLFDRGVEAATWYAARIGACHLGRYQGRVIVPVLSVDEDVWLGWVGRAWSPRASLRYYYPSGMRRGLLLYNHAAIHVETDEPVLLVEGVFDALPVWPRAVAFLGKPSREQYEALLLSRRPLAVMLDGDAHEEGEMLAAKLRMDGMRAGHVRLPPTTDPNVLNKDWLFAQANACIQGEL